MLDDIKESNSSDWVSRKAQRIQVGLDNCLNASISRIAASGRIWLNQPAVNASSDKRLGCRSVAPTHIEEHAILKSFCNDVRAAFVSVLKPK
ncbi:MAG: hypothetical protein QF733_04490 [Phycisphaerales bacterium]|jgi:hypothetical protein|nr:hypothetical protein [Phycisphaerales bacterium]